MHAVCFKFGFLWWLTLVLCPCLFLFLTIFGYRKLKQACFWVSKLTCSLQYDCIMNVLKRATVKPVLSGHSKRRPKIGFHDQISLNADQKYCRMLQESILQYVRPSLSCHLSLRPLFCLCMSGPLRQILLYLFTIPENRVSLTKKRKSTQKEDPSLFCFVWFNSLRPINNLSIM